MNTKSFVSLGVMVASLALAGCESSDYPNTYQIPISNTQVNTNAGIQNTGVTGVKDVSTKPGYPLYFQATSPVTTNIAIYEKDSMSSGNGGGSRGALLTQLQGTVFDTSVTPNSVSVEFVFTPAFGNTAGTVQLSTSDRPISPPLVTTSTVVPIQTVQVQVPVQTVPMQPAPATTTTTTTTSAPQ